LKYRSKASGFLLSKATCRCLSELRGLTEASSAKASLLLSKATYHTLSNKISFTVSALNSLHEPTTYLDQSHPLLLQHQTQPFVRMPPESVQTRWLLAC
jgi:hypothetical protein